MANVKVIKWLKDWFVIPFFFQDIYSSCDQVKSVGAKSQKGMSSSVPSACSIEDDKFIRASTECQLGESFESRQAAGKSRVKRSSENSCENLDDLGCKLGVQDSSLDSFQVVDSSLDKDDESSSCTRYVLGIFFFNVQIPQSVRSKLKIVHFSPNYLYS